MVSVDGSDHMTWEEDSKRRGRESKKQCSHPETEGRVSSLEMKSRGEREVQRGQIEEEVAKRKA